MLYVCQDLHWALGVRGHTRSSCPRELSSRADMARDLPYVTWLGVHPRLPMPPPTLLSLTQVQPGPGSSTGIGAVQGTSNTEGIVQNLGPLPFGKQILLLPHHTVLCGLGQVILLGFQVCKMGVLEVP